MNNEYAIDVRNLNKSFGSHHVVKNISLQVSPGEIFGFLGPNGSGKTTTIRMLCGLLTPDSGEGTCLGFDIIKDNKDIKRNMGYMTQKFSMWDDLTIYENLEFVARMYDIKERKEAIERTLRNLNFEMDPKQLAGSLSGGWKQRMALAACMLHNPKLFLLDEPTAGVDPKARRDFWEQLYKLAAQGCSVLVSTHYMDEADRCNKLAYIFNGTLIAKGTGEEIVKEQNLITFSIRGENLAKVSEQLEGKPGIDQTIIFGNELHVSGKDGPALKRTLSDLQQSKHCNIKSIETSLEDVFVHLMRDNE